MKQIEGAALIGIDVAKEADLGEWYQQVITKGQMISYYDVRSHIAARLESMANFGLGCWMVSIIWLAQFLHTDSKQLYS